MTPIHPAIRFTVEPMSERDIPAAQGLSRAVGWPHTSHVVTMARGSLPRHEGAFHSFAAINQALG